MCVVTVVYGGTGRKWSLRVNAPLVDVSADSVLSSNHMLIITKVHVQLLDPTVRVIRL